MTDPPWPEDASAARLRLWLRLSAVARLMEGALRERLRGQATTLPRFDVMAALAQAPLGMRMSDLSAALRVSNGNVTGIVDRLEAEALAVREPAPGDRRGFVVRLTPTGLACFAELAARHADWVNELLGMIAPAEADQLADRLQTLRDRLGDRAGAVAEIPDEARPAGGPLPARGDRAPVSRPIRRTS